jgi:hypothetical protein
MSASADQALSDKAIYRRRRRIAGVGSPCTREPPLDRCAARFITRRMAALPLGGVLIGSSRQDEISIPGAFPASRCVARGGNERPPGVAGRFILSP